MNLDLMNVELSRTIREAQKAVDARIRAQQQGQAFKPESLRSYRERIGEDQWLENGS